MGIFEDVGVIQDLGASGSYAQEEGKALIEWGVRASKLSAELRREVDAGTTLLPDAATRAQSLLDARAEILIISDDPIPFTPTEPAPKINKDGSPAKRPGRKPKSAAMEDAAATPPAEAARQAELPMGAKPHASEGRVSPLTPDLRSKLEATLAHGPLQFPEIRKMSWTTGMTDERLTDLLCEDPAAFVQWAPKNLMGLEVWGTVEHFDKAVGTMCMPGIPKSGRPKLTADHLGCSIGAAVDAWKRLDPESP